MARRLFLPCCCCCGLNMRRQPLLVLLLMITLLILLLYLLVFHTALITLVTVTSPAEIKFFEENYLKIGSGSSGSSFGNISQQQQSAISTQQQLCQLPLNVHPLDQSVLPYLTKLPEKVSCDSNFAPLTYINEDEGVLRQNLSTDVCHFRLLKKHPENDAELEQTSWQRLNPLEGYQLNELENYLAVRCDRASYENIHFWFNPEKAKEKEKSFRKEISPEKPSVIILVIESLSRLNYLRYLNRTRHFLETQLSPSNSSTYYLEGLNKMADNSFPNMVPLLTGSRLYAGELPAAQENYGPYDDWPFIWKKFSNSGYLTALQEDYPKFTLFNYESKGFVRGKPTDFYPRPYWIELFSDTMKLMSTFFPFNISPCYKGRVPKVDLFLDQLSHLVKRVKIAKSKPLFAYSFYIELTHNDFNKAQTIDSHLAGFLERSKGELSESIFILMGDHGNRFGPILQTTVGRIEERMPLFAMHLPEKLSRKYPSLGQNLRANRRSLTTWLDIHQMLLDVVEENYQPTIEPTIDNPKRAYSPWRERIPATRTCAQALIPELYCACDRRLPLEGSGDANPLAHSASVALIDHLNQKLLAEESEKCHKLKLNQTLRAELIFPSDSTAQARGYRQWIEVTLTAAAPSGAMFRSRLFRTAHRPSWTVDGAQVTRINEYGDQSWCIQTRSLKPFCACRERRKVGKENNKT